MLFVWIYFVLTELKLIDFGGALHIADDEVHEDGIGTPYYIAPEIIDADFNQPRTGKVLFIQSISNLFLVSCFYDVSLL
jgi:serine/threonine protein kinase